MEGRRSSVSSRSFASDLRPVPNIVARYERPRHKIRRDATHVLGGMFGWNTSEEADRSLRGESSRGEEEATAAPDSATPVDATSAGPSQCCTKKPVKRTKRRGFAPLVDMGASILSMRFQELLRRQHQPEEEEIIPVSVPAKRRSEPAADAIISPATSSASGKAKALASGDAPVKRIRLTINTAPPIDTSISTTLPHSFLQMPPSPPDTSSNDSKAPSKASAFGVISASTPKDSIPIPADFDSTLNFDLPDSDSSSSSSSESSSDLDSDSVGLSSSTSTRSAAQNKGKEKVINQVTARLKKSTQSVSPSPTPPPPVSNSRPSTPPRKKRPARKPGWVGWVQTEESPDHSRLIRLDDAPVILGRRTRSGKEFHDPPPLPPSRRKSSKGAEPTPDQQTREPAKPARRFNRKVNAPTGEKSKQQTAWQEAQKRAASRGEADNAEGDAATTAQESNIKDEDKQEPDLFPEVDKGGASKRTDGEPPTVPPENQPPSPPLLSSVPQPTSVATSTPDASSSSEKIAPAELVSSAVSASDVSGAPASGRKLTHSDSAIAAAAGKPGDPKGKDRTEKDLTGGQKSTPTNPAPAVLHAAETVAHETTTTTLPPVSRASLVVTPHPASSAPKEIATSSKAASDAFPSNKPLVSARSEVSKNFSIELKSRPSTSNSAAKPAISKPGPAQNQPGWASDTSTGESSVPLAKLARTGLASPPEKAKRPVQATSANSNPAPSGSNIKAVVTTKIKPVEVSIVPPVRKPGAAPSDRREQFVSKLSRNVEPTTGLSVLGKRKDHVPQASSSHFKKRKISRKLVASSSDESDTGTRQTPGFILNPFERRAKNMELTRKGLTGEALKQEMDKWIDSKRTEWRSARERRREEKRKRELADKSASDSRVNSFHRSNKLVETASGALTDSARGPSKDTSKSSRDTSSAVSRDTVKVSELPRIPKTTKDSSQSDHAGNSPKVQRSISKIWNGDWGMDISKVSVTGSTVDAKNKARKLIHRRESDAANTKDPASTQSSNTPHASASRNRT